MPSDETRANAKQAARETSFVVIWDALALAISLSIESSTVRALANKFHLRGLLNKYTASSCETTQKNVDEETDGDDVNDDGRSADVGRLFLKCSTLGFCFESATLL